MPWNLSRASSSAEVIRRKTDKEFGVGVANRNSNGPVIRVGVCAMDKKACSKPMRAILKRMNTADEFEIVSFGDAMIVNRPVEEWPLCDALMTWHSDGFPLAKAQEYARLRKPFLVNDVQCQDLLLDRRLVYSTLKAHNVPLPTHITVNRTPEEVAAAADPAGFVETSDSVEIDGVTIAKPFVEKPADGEDHNIWIYYPNSMGGGVKTLFRKVGNKSADYLPDHPGTVRRDGSFIYEQFLSTGGTDVKVYTVGTCYAHAEARKSPVVDGKVMRTGDGKEVRFPVLLTPAEKEIARMVSVAFKQKVCGFDLLRSDTGRSYVCDVNGWSFVKNSKKYYDDAAGILRTLILQVLGPHRLVNPLPRKVHVEDDILENEEEMIVDDSELNKNLPDLSDLEAEMEHTNQFGGNEELRCVLAVVRHGDRTPKQKLKVSIDQQEVIDVFTRYKDSKGQQAKLKSPDQLQEFLDAVRAVLTHIDDELSTLRAATGERSTSSQTTSMRDRVRSDKAVPPARGLMGAVSNAAEAEGGKKQEDPEEKLVALREKLRIVRTVLESGGHFSGINRKVQLKPTKRGEGDVVEQLQLIVKWGGVLTHLGRQQAEDLGFVYRMVMYPRSADGGGLLRLHSTYRHDLKLYSSDEGRVQASAAAFIKALLDLEGASLTPILVSLVTKDAAMLDAFGKGASDDIRHSKQVLYNALTLDPETEISHCAPVSRSNLSPPPSPMQATNSASNSANGATTPESVPESLASVMPSIDHLPEAPLQLLRDLLQAITVHVEKIRQLLMAASDGQGCSFASSDRKNHSALNMEAADYVQDPATPYGSESMLMMYDRWRKLLKSFYNKKDDTFDISKVPDLYDSAKYDCIHNRHLDLDYNQLFPIAKKLADCVIGAEYGIYPEYKTRIASKIARELIGKLAVDLSNVLQESLASAPLADDCFESDGLLHGSPEEMETSLDPDSCIQGDRVHRLAPEYVDDINSPLRHVRTRIYFTSESHIYSLINILRYNKINGESLLSEEGHRVLNETREYDYLTQVVLRMYENKSMPRDSPERFRIEIMFSNGANYNPLETPTQSTRPRVPIHHGNGVTLTDLQRHFAQYAAARVCEPDRNLIDLIKGYASPSQRPSA